MGQAPDFALWVQTGQAAARQMVEQNKQTPGRGGAIVNMSSVNGIMAIPTIAPYNVGAKRWLSRSISLRCLGAGVTLTVVVEGGQPPIVRLERLLIGTRKVPGRQLAVTAHKQLSQVSTGSPV